MAISGYLVDPKRGKSLQKLKGAREGRRSAPVGCVSCNSEPLHVLTTTWRPNFLIIIEHVL